METDSEQSSTLTQAVDFEDIMNLASWSRPRDDDELDDFLERRERELERNEAKARRAFRLMVPDTLEQ